MSLLRVNRHAGIFFRISSRLNIPDYSAFEIRKRVVVNGVSLFRVNRHPGNPDFSWIQINPKIPDLVKGVVACRFFVTNDICENPDFSDFSHGPRFKINSFPDFEVRRMRDLLSGVPLFHDSGHP